MTKKLSRIAIDTMTFDQELGEWKLFATFEAVGEKPHSHVVAFRAALAPRWSEDRIRETCTRSVLVAAGRYLIGGLTGDSSATDFHNEYDLAELTCGESAALFGDVA